MTIRPINQKAYTKGQYDQTYQRNAHTSIQYCNTPLLRSHDERNEHKLLRLTATSFVPNTTPLQEPNLPEGLYPYAGNGNTSWNRVFKPPDAAASPISSY